MRKENARVCLGFATGLKIPYTNTHTYIEEEFTGISELPFFYINFSCARRHGILGNSIFFNLPEESCP